METVTSRAEPSIVFLKGQSVVLIFFKPPMGRMPTMMDTVLGIVATLEGKMVLWSDQISEYVEVRTIP